MIASSVFRVVPSREAPSSTSLYLGPFGEEELDGLIPAAVADIPFFPTDDVDLYTKSDPTAMMAALESMAHTSTWGIYKGEVPDSQSFIGTVGLTEGVVDTSDGERFDQSIQEVGIWVIPRAERGKGLGSLAMLAVASYALETHATQIITAWTSANNVGVHRSLAKVGFRCTGAGKYFSFADGADSQTWMLATPNAQSMLERRMSPERAQLLSEGWEQNGRLRQGLIVEEMCVA